MAALDVSGRIYYLLPGIGAACGKQSSDGWVKLTLKVTQQQMSDMLGVNRVTVDNALQDLYSKKITRKEGGFYCVLDAKDLLKTAAAGDMSGLSPAAN